MVSLDSPYMLSYLWLIVTQGLTRLHCEMQGFKIRVILTLTFQGHSGSNVSVIGLAIYAFLLIILSNIGSNSPPLRDIRLWSLSDFDFDLSRSLKVKCHNVIGLTIYAFLLMVNSNIGPNLAPLRDTRLWNPSDLDFDLSLSLKVKFNSAVGFSIDDFLLMPN